MPGLTDNTARRTRPRRNDAWLADGNGLYLRITPAGARSWWFRQTRKGKRIQERIGSLDDYTLAEARLEAAKKSTGSAGPVSVADLAERWFGDRIAPAYRRPHHVRGYLDRALIPVLGQKPLCKIARSDVTDMLAGYRGRGTVAANNLRRIARQMFAYGVELGWLTASPAEGITRRVCGADAGKGHRVLTDEEIKLVWNIEGPHRTLLRLLLVTGLRIGEAQQARWQHVVGKRLYIPAEHSRNHREHWVHLPPLAFEVLGARQADGVRLTATVSPTAVQAWLRRWCERNKIGETATADPHRGAFTPHDLRRTYATRLNDLGVAPHVIEKCLNHTLQGVMSVYNKTSYVTERVDAAETLADEIERLLGVAKPRGARMTARQ